MERLETVQARLHSIQQLLDVVGAMRAMAAARMQQAVAALPGARAYAGIMAEAMADALLLADEPPSPVDGPLAVLAFASEHGFVGAFNESLLDEARRRRPAHLFVAGSRGVLAAEEAGMPPRWSLPMTGRLDGTVTIGRRLAERLYPAFLRGEFVRLDMIHGGVAEGGRWRIKSATVLPLDRSVLPAAGDRPFPPLHTLPPGQLLAELSAQHLLAGLVCAATEALAAENAARLAATTGAHDNIERRLDVLRQDEQLLRQDAITTEILDVITGAEMLLHPRGRRRD
jgi:F-type H+-transporting ATPase subunit gamma